MKNLLLLLSLVAFPALSQAQTPTDSAVDVETDPNIFLELSSGPGYVGWKDDYSKGCSISKDGTLHYIYEAADLDGPRNTFKIVEEFKIKLSSKKMKKLSDLADEVRKIQGPFGTYQTYSGDAPGYDFQINNAGDSTVLVHSEGQDMTRQSKAARKLRDLTARLCGMKHEVKMMIREENSGL